MIHPFKPLELADRATLHEWLWRFQPETSELTFTNLFIWREYFGWEWAGDGDWLWLVAANRGYALPPIGPAPRAEAARRLLRHLRDERGFSPRLERVDAALTAELAGTPDLRIEPTRNQFDYVYRTEALATLAGRKYSAKRNQLNRLQREYPAARYLPLTPSLTAACQELAGRWCEIRRCDEDGSLLGEWEAVQEALVHFAALQLQGGAIELAGQLVAFALGEPLNAQTAVIHIEKADPTITGLYVLINQQFAAQAWAAFPFINREQDLGDEGLRQAKLSYNPDRLVEKFRISLP
jgi:hypothetical protein